MAGVVVIAAVALGMGLEGCGSDTKTAPSAAPNGTTTSTAGPVKTIADYIKENNITETPVHRGDPGSPTINMPLLPDWQQAGSRTPESAYDAILYNTQATAADSPTIITLVSKLVGNVDAGTILADAPGEIKKLPGYSGPPDGGRGKLSGFDAIQIGGSYLKDGVRRAVGQMTAVIPGQDGLYVLQLNAESAVDQAQTLAVATAVIAQQAKITP
jgi:hypothetical protein